MANQREPAERIETGKVEAATEEAAPGKDVKYVRISVNGRPSKIVGGAKFTSTPTLYKTADLKWKDDEWAEARKDPHLVIEDVDKDGKLIPKAKE